MSPRKPLTVLFDTNFLMVPIRFGVDVISELDRLLEVIYHVTVLTPVIDELYQLKKDAKPSDVKEFDFALNFASRLGTIKESLYPGEDVDRLLIRISKENLWVVATTDSVLRARLREHSIPVIYLRQSKKLALDGHLN